MDIWLLAAQLALGGGAVPLEVAEAEAPFYSRGVANAALPLASPACSHDANPSDAEGCPTSGGSMATATPAQQPGGSMGAAATRWPSPEQVMTPGRRPIRPHVDPEARPVTGAQLYQFRTAALQAGELYAQVAPYRYINLWQRAFISPTHGDWQALLAAEAAAMARRQGQPLTVMVGDSLALWLPVNELPRDQLWLNQSISGETTTHMLGRLHYFADTQPQTIYLMAGINDLKAGVPEAQVIDNLYSIMTRLRQQHPQARLVVYSILPTRLREVPSDRIQRVNQRLAALAVHQGATYVDLYSTFSDRQGLLRVDLTTDGLHLSSQGYTLWQAAMVSH